MLLFGCIADREPYEADPLVSIASLHCEIAGAQIVIDGTFDVRLRPGEEFRVEHAAGLAAGTKANAYYFFGCNEWRTMQQGCERQGDDPQTQSVSVHMTDNVTGTLPDLVRVEVKGVVDSDDIAVEAARSLTCAR
ncbi:MAG TPA: hypothetical protein VIV40_29760 [Kofleriaceae bacterium]